MNNKFLNKTVSGILLLTMLGYTMPVLAYTKDETVYTKTDSNGSSYQTIVNTHLKNEDEKELLNDMTSLLNIQNVGGNETFSQDGETLVWNTDGEDIYYQGNTDKELPVKFSIKYELDGKEMTSEEIAGKSGNVKVTLNYENLDSHEVTVNGVKTTLYTPFVVLAGTIIDTTNNSNIEISTGKIIEKDSKTVAVGLSLPGMQESLGINKSTLEIPDSIEITMDTTNFELGSIMSFVTPKVFEESDLEIFDKLDELYSKVEQIKSASSEIEEGATTLAEGASTYSEKSNEFNQAMKQMAAGTSTLNSKYTELDSGITAVNSGATDLQTGAENLSAALVQVQSELSTLPDSVAQLYAGTTAVLAGLNGDGTATNLGAVNGVNSLISSTQETTQTLINTLQSISDSSTSAIAVLEGNNKNLQAAVDTLTTIDAEANKDVIASLKTQIATNNYAINTFKAAKTDADNGITTATKKATASATTLKNLSDGMTTIQTSMKTINAGLGQLNESSKSLPTVTEQLVDGSNKLVAGTKKLTTGASQLRSGSTAVKSGLSTLDSSTTKLASANDQLTAGAVTLSEGATTLSQGITTFNTEAIDTICNYVNGDLKNIASRAEKLQQLSQDYNNFAGIDENVKGNVKFVLITDSLKNDAENK